KKNQDLYLASQKNPKRELVESKLNDRPKTANPEVVHDMRVATRRLRAAIKIFKAILPVKAKKIGEELEKMGRVLGKKRDLDVFSEFISHTIHAKSPALQKLARQIDRSQNKIRQVLKSKSNKRFLKTIEKLEAETTKQNILKASRKWIRNKLKKVLKIAFSMDSKVDDNSLHKLRIALKMLRYTCEFFEPLFSKYICSLGSFIEKTTKLQDILGDHQDAIKGISILNRYKNKFSDEEILQITNKYESKKMRNRKLFFKIWKDYWYGKGFHSSCPTTAIELIL
ncbi:MAG: CHAD domain-containing protein, partial [Parachlamydiaceae bacterium]|nr:CHAD domain-containing protein [Parachlamydiaceae bacterium]